MDINLVNASTKQLCNLLISLVVPRPITAINSVSAAPSPYAFCELTRIDEIAGARLQGRDVAEIAKKLSVCLGRTRSGHP